MSMVTCIEARGSLRVGEGVGITSAPFFSFGDPAPIADHAGHGPHPAYKLAMKREISSLIWQLWKGHLRSKPEGEAWIPDTSESKYSRSPEAALVEQEETDTREACIEQFVLFTVFDRQECG